MTGWRRLGLFALLLLVPAGAGAQTGFAFWRGQVKESEQRSGLAFANLRVRETGLHAVADSAGRFLLRVAAQQITNLEAQAAGYFAQTLRLPAAAAGETLRCEITLAPNPITLGEVLVIGDRIIESTPALINRTAAQALRQPGAFEDPLRMLQQIPGVSLRSDWDSQISVRGATPDQNLVVIDGFTLPNPYRLQFALGGGMSLLNVSILQRVQLWKSGFSARYGDRIAGLVALHTQSPFQPRRFEARLNVFDASFTAALPTSAQRDGILFAVRRNYHDAFSRLAPLQGYAIPRWQDLQIKAAHQFSPQHQIEAFAFWSKEWLDLTFGDADKLNIQEQSHSAFLGLTSRWAVKPNLIWENYLSHFQAPTQTLFQNALASDSTAAAYDFDDRLWAWRSELTRQPSVRTQWLLGMEWHRQRQWADLTSRFDNRDSPVVLPEDYQGRRWRTLAAVYGESKWAWSEKLILQAGLRAAGEISREGAHLEPRVSLSGAWSRFHYFVHAGNYRQTLDWQSLFRREWPMDLSGWRALPAEKAWLLSLETTFRVSRASQLALAAYWRRLDPMITVIDESEGMTLELRERQAGGVSVETPALQANRPRVTRGLYMGIESAWSLTQPTWHFTLRYAYARSRMRDLDDTHWIGTATDRPHDALMEAGTKLPTRVEISGLARYTTGNPYSPVLALARDPYHERWPEGYRFVYDLRNSARYPAYFRTDLRLSYAVHARTSDWQVYVECLNLSNRENLYQILWTASSDVTTTPNVARREIPMMPRLFLGGLAVKF